MSQALYRTYRARSFAEVAAQEHITKTLQNAIAQGTISHAYLFTGPRGVGKTSIARILAHEINGLPYSDKPHLDIIEIDAASNRRIEDIRELREKVHIAPTSAKYKVYIIDEVHMLTTESFNALLKTLEEPPAHVVFMLATTEIHKLPATITSRAQRFALRAPTIDDITKQLLHIAKQENIAIDKAALTLIAEHGDGSFRDSISLFDQMRSSVAKGASISEQAVTDLLGLPAGSTLDTLLNATLEGDATEAARIVTELTQTGISPATVALGLIKRAMPHAATQPIAAQLLNQLIEVGRSAQPHAKLLAVLLQIAHGSLVPKKSTSKPLLATNDTVVAEALPSRKKSQPTPKPASAEALQKAPTPQPTVANPITYQAVAKQWGDILMRVKSHSPPLFGALKTAEVRTTADGITLAFKYTLHRARVNDSKHKSVLAAIISEVTHAPAVHIETIVDSHAEPTSANETPQTPAAAAVIDLMGGGQVVSVGV